MGQYLATGDDTKLDFIHVSTQGDIHRLVIEHNRGRIQRL